MEGTHPETRLTQARSTRPGPLSALALLVVVPATIALPLWESRPIQYWSSAPQVWLTILTGGAIVVLVGRGPFGIARSLGLLLSSWLALAFSLLVVLAIGFAELGCDGPSHPFRPWVAVAAGAVYLVVGYWALRTGRWWGLPVAILLAIATFLGLTFALPGPPRHDCGRGPS